MGDLISPFNNPAMPAPGLEGDSILSRGSEPSVDMSAGGGSSGLDPVWNGAPVSTPGGEETANSVSGLPQRPSRWEPSDNPPSPPDLTDRNPGTIDQ